jgi:cyanophycinase
MSLGADTAYNLTISSTAAANLQATFDELISAKSIFIRGGDQWNYIRLWKGTKTDSAINNVFQNGGVIAGTSAGEAVLGDVDFSARLGSAYPDQSLLNPYNSYLQFEDNFLNFVPDVIFDSHFIERGRHGRLIAMLYNRYFVEGRILTGIGIDDRTALCISPDGIAEVMGSGAVSIFTIDDETLLQPVDSGNYTIERLKCDQLIHGWKYDLNNKEISFIPGSARETDTLRSWQLPLTDFWVTGSDNIPIHLQASFNEFLQGMNNVVIISNPGFSASLIQIGDYISQASVNHTNILLNVNNLDNSGYSSLISSADGFVFAGDSLNIIALLKDTTTLIGNSFRNRAASVPLFFFGKPGKITAGYYINNLYTDPYASYRGRMSNNTGLNIFPDLIFEPALFNAGSYYENQMSSVLWGLMLNRKRLGVYLHGNASAFFNSSQKSIKTFGTYPPIYINASRTSLVDSSVYRASGSSGTRQVVAMNNLRYNISTYDGIKYLIEDGKFEGLSSAADNETSSLNLSFILHQNYPNPFNPETVISFFMPSAGFVNLRLYNILGSEIKVLIDEYMNPGLHRVNFNSGRGEFPSGIYFYRLSINGTSETKSMMLIK